MNLQPPHSKANHIIINKLPMQIPNCHAFDMAFEYMYRFVVARASEYSVLVLTEGCGAVLCVVSGAELQKTRNAFTITRHGSREKC